MHFAQSLQYSFCVFKFWTSKKTLAEKSWHLPSGCHFAVSVYMQVILLNSCLLHDRPKHSYKVHVWAGISLCGRTGICIFTGNMDWCHYVNILEKTLGPFVRDVCLDSHRFVADNDPIHSSLYTRDILTTHNINWWHISVESADLYSSKNVWHELKEYIWKQVKPTRKEELI